MKFNDVVFGVLLIALGGFVLWQVQGFPKIPGQQYGAGAFPGVIAVGLLIIGVALFVGGVRRRADGPWVVLGAWTRSGGHGAALVAVLLGVVAYIFWADDIGFLLMAPALLALWFLMLGTRPVVAVPVAILVALIIWFAFYKMLRVPLPWGVLKSFAF